MIIKKRIKLDNINYYISVNCEYKEKEGQTNLFLKGTDELFDGGNLTELIKKVETNYNKEEIKKYNKDVSFLADCLYIYENIPFISGVGNLYFENNDITSLSYITKEELDNFNN